MLAFCSAVEFSSLCFWSKKERNTFCRLSGSCVRNLSCPAVGASYFGVFVYSIFEAGKLVSCLLQNGWLSLSVPGLEGGGLTHWGPSFSLELVTFWAGAKEEPRIVGARCRGTLPATSWDTQRFEVTTLSSAGSLSGKTSSVLQKGRQFISRVKWETQKEREGGTWKKEQLSLEGSGRKREKLTLIVGVCHFHNSSLTCYIWFPFVGKKTKAQKHSVD